MHRQSMSKSILKDEGFIKIKFPELDIMRDQRFLDRKFYSDLE